MIPKFKIDKDERLMIGEKYISNGHWLVNRPALVPFRAPKAIEALSNLKHGSYSMGLKDGITSEELPKFEAVIPRREGYELLFEQPQGVEFRGDTDEVYTYVYKTQKTDMAIGINPKYSPLLRMGHAFARGPMGPILILSGNTLNDELVAMVMPMRLKEST